MVSLLWLGWTWTDWRRVRGRPLSNGVEGTYYEAPELEGRDSTKEPRCLACLRTPTKGRTQREVNITEQGGKQP